MLKKHIEYNKFKKRFKELNKIKQSSVEIYFNLISLYNDCKEYNLSVNYLFLLSFINDFKLIYDNCSARVFDVFYSFEKNSDYTFDDFAFNKSKPCEISFRNKILELKQENRYLSISQIKKMFNENKVRVKISKWNINEITDKVIAFEQDIPEERFFWSRSLNDQNLLLFLLGSQIYCCKNDEKWIIYENDKIILDNLSKNLSVSDLEDLIIDYFRQINFEYNHLLLLDFETEDVNQLTNNN